MVQYAVRVRVPAIVKYGNDTEYWIPACAGMTPEFDFRFIATARGRPYPAGQIDIAGHLVSVPVFRLF
jgi:hypothetical protein